MNEYEDLLEMFENLKNKLQVVSGYSNVFENRHNTVKKLVDRATPKKPCLVLVPLAGTEHHCIKCSHTVYKLWSWNNEYVPKFCSECGQAIDWSDDEHE